MRGDATKVVEYIGLTFRIKVWAGEAVRGEEMATVQTGRLDEVTKSRSIDEKEQFQGPSHRTSVRMLIRR